MKKITVIITGFFVTMFSLSNICKANELTLRQQSIIPIAAFAGSGDLDKLILALNEGLDNGLTVNEIKEILVQVYAYAGFPRSLNAISTFMTVMEKREKQGIKDILGLTGKPLENNINKYEYGAKIQTELMGAPNKAAYQDFTPAIGSFLKEHLFADIFARGVLNYQEREIVTVSILSNMSGVDGQLAAHLKVALNTGLSEIQIQSIISVLENKVSKKSASHTHQLFDKILQSRK